MRILGLSIRNVFAFGNNTQHISFVDSNEATMNILLGKNGSGKSSLINCLKLGMYFDKVPIGVSDVSNEINGNGYIKVDLESFNSVWSIESNYTKTSMKSIIITKDGVVKDTGKLPETKKFVYENILDIEYHIFSNIISLSMADFKSFIAMNAKDTRLIRDRIFGFFVLNEMNEQNKLGIKKYTDKLTENNIKKDFIESEIEKLKSNLNSDEKIAELEQEIKTLEESNIAKTELSNNKIFEIEECQNESELALKYMEYSSNEKTKINIKLQQLELEKVKANIENLKNSEQKISEEIDNIVSDIQIYYKKNSLKQYNDYLSLLSGLNKKFAEQSKKNNEIRGEYNNLVQNKLYNDFNDIIDKVIEDFENIKETRNQYTRELTLKIELSNQYDELIKLRDEEQKNYNSKSEQIKRNKGFIDLYASGKCPTCETSFENNDYHNKITELTETNEILVKDIDVIKDSIKSKDDIILKLGGDIDVAKRKMIEFKLKLKSNFNPVAQITFNTQLANIITEGVINILANYYKLLTTYLDTENMVEFGNDCEMLTNLKIGKSETFENIDIKKHELDNIDKELNETISKQKLYKEEVEKFDKTKSDEINQMKYSSVEITDTNVVDTENKLKELKEKSISQLIISEHERKLSIESDIEKLNNNLIEDESQFEQCIKKYESSDAAEAKLKELEIKSKELSTEINTITTEINNNIQTINNNKLIITNNKELMKDKLKEYNKQIDDILKEYNTSNTILVFLKIVEYTLSDKGIKSFIIGKIIPYINQSVNHILNQFDLPLAIKFDDEFKPAIYRFGNEVSYRTISLGQSKMIDYSIIITVIKFIKNKCTNLNVVFLDEIFSSLHVSMLPIILEITKKEIVDNLGMDVFLVNHSLISPTFFDNKVEMIVDNNFSKIKITNIISNEEKQEIAEI